MTWRAVSGRPNQDVESRHVRVGHLAALGLEVTLVGGAGGGAGRARVHVLPDVHIRPANRARRISPASSSTSRFRV